MVTSRKTVHFAIVFLVLNCGLLLSASSAVQVTFLDGNFDRGDWEAEIIDESGPAALFGVQRSATGGNPDAYRRLQHTYGGNGFIVTGHRRVGSYDPASQGSISSVAFSFDLIGFDFGASNAVGYGALIFQNDSYYVFGGNQTTIFGPTTNVWRQVETGPLSATDFNRILGTGPLNPDFSSSGAELRLGYFGSNGTSGGSQTSTDSGIDNWSVVINPVPEPGVAGLLCLLLLGQVGLRRRHNSSSIK